MTWEALHAGTSVVVAAIGFANVYVMLLIRKELAEAVGALKEWTRGELEKYATKREVDQRFDSRSCGD